MKLYNTLSRTIEPFSAPGDVVGMYVCGITPYASSHVGHAMRGVVFDVLRRYLEFKGYKVRHVENFTDIDDKMIKGAADQGISTQELAERHIEAYLQEMDGLNMLRAHVYPRATQEIPRILEMTKALVDKGFAYAVNGDVYFRVRRHEGYGKLSRRSLDSMRAGARVEVDERKEDAMDFALWKSKKPGEPSWDSPWGEGRPGWHIECSAMSMAYLGAPIDIHGGGQELTFPHHENEIAQTEAYTDGRPMARFWVHNGLLRLGSDKMSKSLGNFVTVEEALDRFSSDALRLFFLSSHYRSPLVYSDDGVAAEERAAERLRVAAQAGGESAHGDPLDAAPHEERFVAAMDNDLNTPQALAAIFDLTRDINRSSEDGRDVAGARATLKRLCGVLGLNLKAHEGGDEADSLRLAQALPAIRRRLWEDRRDVADRMTERLASHGIELGSMAGTPEMPGQAREVGPVIELMIELRADLRRSKHYELADYVRDALAEVGFVLEDTAHGTEWKRRSP